MVGRRSKCIYEFETNFLTWRSEIKRGNKTFKISTHNKDKEQENQLLTDEEDQDQLGFNSVKATITKTIIKTSEARTGNKKRTKTQSLLNNIYKLNSNSTPYSDDNDNMTNNNNNNNNNDNDDTYSSYSMSEISDNQKSIFNIPQLFSMFNYPQFSTSERHLNTTTIPYQIHSILQFVSQHFSQSYASVEIALLDHSIILTPIPKFIKDLSSPIQQQQQQQEMEYIKEHEWTFIPIKTSDHLTTITTQIKERTRLLLSLAFKVKSMSSRNHIFQNIHACIHRYVSLMIQIESEEFYAQSNVNDDDDDDQDQYNPDCSMFPFLVPDINDFKQCVIISVDTIPDATWILDASFVYNGLDESNHQLLLYKFRYATDAETQLLDYLIHFLYKTNPHPCYGRQLHALCSEACRNKKCSSFFVDFIGKILLAGMLGVYSSAENKPSLDVCVQLYALYKDGISRDSLLASLTDKTAFALLYFAREYTYHLIDQSPSFSKFVKTQPNWENFRANKVKICDRLRQTLYSYIKNTIVPLVRSGELTDSFNVLGECLMETNRACRLQCKDITNVFSKEGNLHYNMRAVYEVFDNHNLVTYHDRWKSCRELQSITKTNYKMWCGKEYLLPDPTPHVPPEVEEMIRQFVDVYYQDDDYMTRHMPLHWLVLVGMSVEGCCKMRQAVFSKNTVLEKTVRDLDRRDFLLAFTLFKCMRERFMLVPIRGCKSYFVQRMVNMIEFFNVKPEETFPAVAAMTLVCPSCKDIKDQVFHQQHVVGQTGLGAGKVKMNDEGKYYCARHVSRNDWDNIFPRRRKRRYTVNKIKDEDQDQDEDDDNDDDTNKNDATTKRKIAKLIQTQHEIKKCETTRTIELYGLYGPSIFNGTVYMACCNCGKIVDKYQVHYLEKSMVCSSCFVANIDEKRYTIEKCEYCESLISNRKKVMKFTLFDDCHGVNDISKQQFREMYFCTNHNPLSWIHTNNIISKQQVMTGIMNNWGKSKDNSRFNIIQVGDISSAGEYNFMNQRKQIT